MQELAVKIFGSPVNWNLNPNTELVNQRVEKRMEQLRSNLVESVQRNTIPSDLKHELGVSPLTSPSKRLKIQPIEELDTARQVPVYDDPLNLNAVFTVDNPETPELPSSIEYVENTAVEEVELKQSMNPEKPENEIPNAEQVPSPTPAEIPSIQLENPEEEITQKKVKPPPRSEPLRERVTNTDLNLHYSNYFTGKFKISACEDRVPNEDEEYEDVVIAPREKTEERKRKEPKRYNDEDFEDIDEEGNIKKPKQVRKRSATLESQFGVEKGRFILKPVTEVETLKLLTKPKKITLCDKVANKQLPQPKTLRGYIPVHIGDYYYGHIANSPTGIYLIALFKLALKNILQREKGLLQVVMGRVLVKQDADEEAKQMAEILSPDRIYSFRSHLCNNLRKALEEALPKFIHYKELLPVTDIPGEQMPRNSLELILLYDEFKAAHETGLEPDSLYIVQFSQPRALNTSLPFSQSYRVKYQQMVQFYWLYLLLHPQKLIAVIAAQIRSREDDAIDRIAKSLPKFDVNLVVKNYLEVSRNAPCLEFLETFITFATNAEALFGVECYKKLFKDFHITVEKPRTQSMSSFLKQQIK